MQLESLVIIGAGPGGVAAAIQSKRLGLEPVLIDRTGCGGGLVANAFSVENYPGFSAIRGPVLADRLDEQLFELGIPVIERNVTAIEQGQATDNPITAETSGTRPARSGSGNGFILHLSSGADHGGTESSHLSTRTVIIATGTSPRRLNLPGETELSGQRLFYEVRNLLASPFWLEHSDHSKKRIVVIGGGEAALNYSLTLARTGARIDLLVRGKSYRARGKLVELVDRDPAIDVHFQTVCSEIVPPAQGEDPDQSFCPESGEPVEQIDLKLEEQGKASVIQAGAILCAIGRTPRSGELVAGCQVGPQEPVITSTDGLYIIGDARLGGLGQVAIAAGDGLMAASAAAEYLAEETIR